MAKKGARQFLTLSCSVCRRQNYRTQKNKTNDPDNLELNKFCRFCRQQTLHKEAKEHSKAKK
ncbi:50S ribosomal protein L33 [Candidatus Berkelbacteria bacterium]|nr:50S ribosomal protein L33 [Candidatus Berkelbacteria bacterium]MBI2588397.1 50S ribosomal protein L33 [Candidatus Berkelbacteria bacterium]MBI4029640.1 50S ribosomal protein L33 [Candidatus Berkelbacteria bacterium]